MEQNTWKEKNILITGASSGIGEACARYLSSLGYTVILVARRKEKMEQIISELPGRAFAYSYDLTDTENLGDIFEFCLEKNIKLDGLIHSAGMQAAFPIKANSIDIMERVMNVNYYSFVELGRNFLKRKYSNDGASIIAISSYSTLEAPKGLCMYASAKSAMETAVKIMSKEFIRREFRVNAILPSMVYTPLTEDNFSVPEKKQSYLKSQPLGIMEPIDIAYLAEFLLTDKAKYITGAIIPISGGR